MDLLALPERGADESTIEWDETEDRDVLSSDNRSVHYLLEKGWGWQRLLPYRRSPVGWPAFKGYLKDYFRHNKDEIAALCAHCNPDPIKQVGSGNILHVAASLCLKIEDKLLESCLAVLTDEDIKLSHEIKERANYMIKSGGASLTAAAGFVCIAKEAELICLLSKLNFDTIGMIDSCNDIRQSALNLMLYEEPEPAAAMLGMAKEAKYMRCHLSSELVLVDSDFYMEYAFCSSIRNATAKVLTMLEDDFCSETACDGTPNAKSEKPMRIATVSELTCQESDPKQNYNMDVDHCEKDNDLKGKKRKRRNKKSNNQVGKMLKGKMKLREKKRRRLQKIGNEPSLTVAKEGPRGNPLQT